MRKVKLIDTGLDIFIMDSRTNENIGKATFEQEYELDGNCFNTFGEWKDCLNNNYIITRNKRS